MNFKLLIIALIISAMTVLSSNVNAQYFPDSFGKGLKVVGKDSTFAIRFGLRFQTLMSNGWDVTNDDLSKIGNHESSFLLRRSRFKFDGFILNPKLSYKLEFSLSNRDQLGGHNAEHGFTPLYMRDAYVKWNFYKNFSIRAGQGKLPGNRERVISSANLQLVDRSILNSKFNIDRDLGLVVDHHFKIGENFTFKEIVSMSNGEGIGITGNNIGGYDYTFRLEMLPFGNFKSKGDYLGGATTREDKVKLAIAATYDLNVNAARQSGQLGAFIYNLDGTHTGKTLQTTFVDFILKYKGLSVMGEYAMRSTTDGNFNIYDDVDPTQLVGTYYVGNAYNIMAGWLFNNNIELTGRYTHVQPEVGVGSNITESTLGLSKYFVGHKLKIQTDVTYRQLNFANDISTNGGADDYLFWRLQLDVHF